jgi:hypothetical protein
VAVDHAAGMGVTAISARSFRTDSSVAQSPVRARVLGGETLPIARTRRESETGAGRPWRPSRTPFAEQILR